MISFAGYPQRLLRPIYRYLRSRLEELKRKKADLQQADPYKNRLLTEGLASPDRKVAELTKHETMAALSENLDRDLKMVEQAMQKIQDGSYGFCNQCHGMINTDRLAIYPEAVYCVRCEQERESSAAV